MADIEVELSYTIFSQLGEQMVREIDNACETTAWRVVTAAKISIMNPPKSGRVYQRGKRAHQASAPGEAPATDVGNLVNSALLFKTNTADWLINWNAEYAAALEYGTPRILPRPFLRPAMEGERMRFYADIADIMRSL